MRRSHLRGHYEEGPIARVHAPIAIGRDTLSTVELDLRLQGVTVKQNLADDLPSILADSGQLHQACLNLITNAMEAMTGVATRARMLTVTSSIVAGSSDIAVTMEGTGPGIAAQDSGLIIEQFFFDQGCRKRRRTFHLSALRRMRKA